jgi:AraC-like DNA-binding protein
MQRLSTDDVPERDRVAFVHDFVARHVARLRFRPLDERNLQIKLAAFTLPQKVTVGVASYTPLHGERTRELLRDGRDNYLMTVHSEPHEVSVDGRRPIKVNAGDLMLVNEGRCSEFHLRRTVVKVLSLDRLKLARLAPRIDLDASYRIPSGTAALSLLAGYADLLRRNPPSNDRAKETTAHHLYDLTALVLDGFVKGGTARNERSIRAARLELIKRDILDRLCDAELDINSVAQRQGVSPRYIQQLFKSEGTSFSDFLRDGRLALAYERLCDSDPHRYTIAMIAFDSGFSDLSTFNRAFRRRYAMTPSDIRADAIAQHGQRKRGEQDQ